MIGVIPSGSEVAVISSNTEDVEIGDQFIAAGSVPKMYILVIASGVTIGASTTGALASVLHSSDSDIHPSSTLFIKNDGYILGYGGAGRNGAYVNKADPFTGQCHSVAGCSLGNPAGPYVAGGPGGDGIRFYGSLNKVIIDNTNGSIWGGGGGGGSGGVLSALDWHFGSGGGGQGQGYKTTIGGGAAGGVYQNFGSCTVSLSINLSGGDGGDTSGSTRDTFVAGAGGQGASQTGGTYYAGDGGDGGAWATTGNAGTNPAWTSCTSNAGVFAYSMPTAGGLPGHAVRDFGAGNTYEWIGGSGAPNVKGAIP